MNDAGAFDLITTIKEAGYSSAALKAIRGECNRCLSVLDAAAAKEFEAGLSFELAAIKNNLFCKAFESLPTNTANVAAVGDAIDKHFHNLDFESKWVELSFRLSDKDMVNWTCSSGSKCHFDIEPHEERKITIYQFRFSPVGQPIACCEECSESSVEKAALECHPSILRSLREEFVAYCSSRLAKRRRRE